MSVLSVRFFGDPVLKERAEEVTTFDSDIQQLVKDMTMTMKANGGVGLAANQVGVLKRVFVYDCEGIAGCVINPEWTAVGEKTQTDAEGCLSIPGVRGLTTRAEHVICKGYDQNGTEITLDAHDLLARCIQHETDHLDGVLFLQRLEPEERRQAMRDVRESSWFNSSTPAHNSMNASSFFARKSAI